MIGFISEKLLIPILDFFYGLVPSYGLAIVALTVVIRIALFPLSAGSIRSARRMKIAQPVMQKKQAEIKSKFSGNPKKQQEELGKLMNEFGSPLAGCLPLIVIFLFVILYLNHNALTIAAKVNGKPRIVIPASRFIIKSLLAGPPS